METEYRIKEVNVPLNEETLTNFYPQVKITTKHTKGYLWWKKIVEHDLWCSIYSGDGKLWTSQWSINNSPLIVCDTKEDAEKIISDYKKQEQEKIRNSYKISGKNWNDERFVTIHPIK